MCSFKMNDYHTTHKFLKQIPNTFTPIREKLIQKVHLM
jgi:hypothetical protein